ncbi:MAG: AAA family ATPase [Gemmatimonadota bacterium]|nr:AAA family ATPase [Gemmatimonadota bacterium]
MSPVRFLRADLEYGCHVRGGITIPAKDAPVVIAGPNGAGKTTLVEALVRTLFGFNRRHDEERECLDARLPWGRTECRGRVEVADGAGRFRIGREFEGGRVEIVPLEEGEDPWSGDGNPASTSAEAREYRRRLGEIFGFSELDHYLSTACVRQGELAGTRLSEDLLRIAAGGHGNVDEALEDIRKAHGRITRRSISPDMRDGVKLRKLERVEGEIADLEEELDRAEAAVRKRAPILRELREVERRTAELEEEIDTLEGALSPLHERRTILERAGRLEAASEMLDRLRGRLVERARDYREAAGSTGEVPGEERYPDDFPRRLGRLEELWVRREEMENDRDGLARDVGEIDVPSPWVGILTLVALLLAAALVWFAFGSALAAGALAVLGIFGGIGLLYDRDQKAKHRADLEERCRELAKKITELDAAEETRKRGIPRADTLGPENVEERKAEYERQRGVLEGAGAAREALEEVLAEATKALAAGAEGEVPEPTAGNAEEIERMCRERLRGLVREIAKQDLALERLEEAELPGGVEPEPEAVERALEERRKEQRELAGSLRELDRRLREEGSAHENPVKLGEALARLEERRAELEGRAAAHEAAFSLLSDAYAEFRERDQERLLEAVSARLADLTDGHLGPVEATGSLSEATIRTRGRSVPLASPPLSYGEWHAALFAIRLGATDFLSRSGAVPPLIVDEPFAWLDLERARELWSLLERIAEDRQVLVATQEELTLEALGVEADLRFERVTG